MSVNGAMKNSNYHDRRHGAGFTRALSRRLAVLITVTLSEPGGMLNLPKMRRAVS